MNARRHSDTLGAEGSGFGTKAAQPISKAILLGLLVLIIVVPYANSLTNGFAWLDHSEILEGGLIAESPGELLAIFLRNDRNYSGYHRPMYNLIHSLDYAIWGDNPAGYHLSSLVLHVANCLVLFLCMLFLTRSQLKSFAVASLWGLLPVNTAVVSLIHSKADLLMTFFLLCCFGV